MPGDLATSLADSFPLWEFAWSVLTVLVSALLAFVVLETLYVLGLALYLALRREMSNARHVSNRYPRSQS